eukprot:GEMP01035466.1.p1 GENE.GEMP01035466.1~~GEMP01035466.1.p1  ORF type:complete len:302 (+),score=59.76 GEMP01035466.1:338-1243(+)
MHMSRARSFADWHVVGAGNLGCTWAVRLHLAGHRAHLVLKDAAKLSAYHGIRIHNNGPPPHWDDYAIPASILPPRCNSEEYQNHLSHVLITTKSHAVIPALQQLSPYFTSQLTLVVLQNGMVDASAVRSIVGADAHVYAATTTEGAHSSCPFHIHRAGDGETLVGALDASGTKTERQKEELVVPGMCWVRDVRFVLWRKLAVNCVIGPLTALYQCRNGELSTIVPDFDDLSRSIVEEVVMMAKAIDGVVLDADDALQYTRAVLSNTAANKSSMYQDVSARRRTEVEAIYSLLTGLLLRRRN